ncbi:hypothetical protein ABPG74_007793 [Tetrahymena malaccensis]
MKSKLIYLTIFNYLVLAQQQCPQYSFYQSEFNYCVCNSGYFMNGNQQCYKCPLNSTPSIQSATQSLLSCNTCLPNYYYSNFITIQALDLEVSIPNCIQCPQGTGTSNQNFQIQSCNICLPNQYMMNTSTLLPSPSPAQCSPCPTGTISKGATQVDKSVCNSCEVNNYMIESSRSPTQMISDQGSAAICIKCPSGSGNLVGPSQKGDISQCSICLNDYYMQSPSIKSSNGVEPSAAVCLPCPANSYSQINFQVGFCTCFDKNASPLSSETASCNCKNGYQGIVATSLNSQSGCFPCPQGSYSNSKTQFKCVACPPKFITNEDQSDCICNQNQVQIVFNPQNNSCECKGGYYNDPLSITGCSRCPDGFYSNADTSYQCLRCPTGSYIQEDQSNCICNDNSLGVFWNSKSKACECQNGYFGNPSIASLNTVGSCTPCPRKQLKQNKISYENQCNLYSGQILINLIQFFMYTFIII